jgi:WD40 repeat protein
VREFPTVRDLQTWGADLSPDGSTVLVTFQHIVRAYAVSSGDVLFQYKAPEADGSFGGPIGVACVRFSCDGKLALAAGGNNTVYLWRTEKWDLVGKFHGGNREVAAENWDYFASAAFSPSGDSIVAGGTNGKLYVYTVPK